MDYDERDNEAEDSTKKSRLDSMNMNLGDAAERHDSDLDKNDLKFLERLSKIRSKIAILNFKKTALGIRERIQFKI